MRIDGVEYISLTDLTRYANKDDPSGVIRNWMSNKKFIYLLFIMGRIEQSNF